MIKAFVLGILLAASTSLETVRTLFFAENQEAANEQLYNSTKGANVEKSPVLLAYNGLATMRKAEFSFNPYTKYNYFKEGRAKLEKAIKAKPNNAEIAFLRLSAQINTPGFLNYNDNISTDKALVIDALKRKIFTDDPRFNKNVLKFMASEKLMSAEQEKELLKLYE